jgi:hypothetical protein
MWKHPTPEQWDHERDLRKHDFEPIPQDIDPRYPPGAEITLKPVNNKED